MEGKIARYPLRSVHIDFHTMPKVDDVGADFDPDDFVRTLKDAHIDAVNVFAKCNLGFAYYPTEIGIPHPGLQCDLLGRMVEACRDAGILVVAYFNAGLDHEHALRHRDWCVLRENGVLYKEDKLDNFFRRMCLNTPYGDLLVSMAGEVLRKYPVDGLFFDCFNAYEPCVGLECQKVMESQGLDILDPASAGKVRAWSNLNFARRIRAITPPDKLLFFNGIPFKDEAGLCSHFELECLPQSFWGYDNFPANVRYSRNLGRHVIGQTARFQVCWGDLGGLRPKEALRFDCLNTASNGVACGIGDHLHPRAHMDKAVYQVIGECYAELAALEPWIKDAKAKAEIGVLLSSDLMEYPISCNEKSNAPVAAAVRMLTELKHQVDVIDWDFDFSKYKVLVMPDKVTVPDRFKDKMRGFIEKGGGVIASWRSGLEEHGSNFALYDKWGVENLGDEDFNVEFLEAVGSAAKDIPPTPITIYKPGLKLKANSAETLAFIWEPYFNKSWDGYHGNFYTPPKVRTDRPALTRNGSVFHFSFPVFDAYYSHAYTAYRTLLANCLDALLPDPLLKVGNAPSFARATLTEKGVQTMIHILSFVPEKRGEKQMIEEPINLRDVKISLRLDGRKAVRVFLAPERTELEFMVSGGRLSFVLPEVAGYKMAVVEMGCP